jgi:hypothetical protein
LGEDVPDTGGVFAHDVGVDAQGHSGFGVAEANGYDVDGDPGEEQRGRMQVTQIVQPGMGSGVAGGVADLLYPLISLAMSALTLSISTGVPAGYAQVLRPLTATLASGNGARPNSDVLDVTGVALVTLAEFAVKTARAWKYRKGRKRRHEDAHRRP